MVPPIPDINCMGGIFQDLLRVCLSFCLLFGFGLFLGLLEVVFFVVGKAGLGEVLVG